MPIEIRRLAVEDLDFLHEIQRREHLTYAYRLDGGALSRYGVDWNIPDWDHVGGGGHSVRRLIDWLHPILDRGAMFFGAFDEESLAGVVVIDPEFELDIAWLTFLHVSRPYRGRGVGKMLWSHAVAQAVDVGAKSIYVSASPSGPTVDFYVGRGCALANPPHPELLKKEPDDIHLVCAIDTPR